jgi:dTDP-4-amino-4,6-dideoxygalactose transaminase
MILMNNFQTEPSELRQQQLLAVERVLQSGWYVLGNEVKQFEVAWMQLRLAYVPSILVPAMK